MNGRRRVMGWGVLGCRPNTTGLRVAGGMPGKPKRIRGCYKKVHSITNCSSTNFYRYGVIYFMEIRSYSTV